MGLVDFGLVEEKARDLVLARGVENVVQVAVPGVGADVAFDVTARPEHLGGACEVFFQVDAQFGGRASDVRLPGSAHDFVRSVVRLDDPVVAQRPVLAVEQLHPDVAQGHVAVEALQIEPVVLRRLLGTLQFEAQADDIDQRGEPLTVLVGPVPVLPDDVDTGIPPHFVAGDQRHDDQRLDVLHLQQIMFARRLGRQFVEIRKDDRQVLLDMLRPPREIVHRERTQTVLLAGNPVRRHLVGAVVRAPLPVELDDIGASAAEHREHLVEYLVHRVSGLPGVQQRQQRVRNAGEAVEQIVDTRLVRPDRPLPLRRSGRPHVTDQHIAIGCGLAVNQFPHEPLLPPVGQDQRERAFERAITVEQASFGAGIAHVRLRNMAFEFVESDFRSRKPEQVLQKTGHADNPAGHVRFPPAGIHIPHDRLQNLVFFHNFVKSLEKKASNKSRH